MRSYAVRVTSDADKEKVIQAIQSKDNYAELDPEGNPVTFWITTAVTEQEIESIPGVAYVIPSSEVCSCGSGKPREALYDARGIFCCYYCDDCGEEKRNRYRPEVLTDSDYIADEEIEPDYDDGLI